MNYKRCPDCGNEDTTFNDIDGRTRICRKCMNIFTPTACAPTEEAISLPVEHITNIARQAEAQGVYDTFAPPTPSEQIALPDGFVEKYRSLNKSLQQIYKLLEAHKPELLLDIILDNFARAVLQVALQDGIAVSAEHFEAAASLAQSRNDIIVKERADSRKRVEAVKKLEAKSVNGEKESRLFVQGWNSALNDVRAILDTEPAAPRINVCWCECHRIGEPCQKCRETECPPRAIPLSQEAAPEQGVDHAEELAKAIQGMMNIECLHVGFTKEAMDKCPNCIAYKTLAAYRASHKEPA